MTTVHRAAPASADRSKRTRTDRGDPARTSEAASGPRLKAGDAGGTGLALLQRLPQVSEPDDPLELEAEAAADRIATGRSAETITSTSGGTVQRAEDEPIQASIQPMADEALPRTTDDDPAQRMADDEPVQRTTDDDPVQRMAGDEPVEATLQRAAAGSPGPTADDSRMVAATIRSPGSGSPMPTGVRARIEPGLGVGLGEVKVHTGPRAEQAASAVNARAFTHGDSIFLNRGESPLDLPLMAHESTHVAQQGAATGLQRTAAGDDEIQRLPAWLSDRLASYSRYIPGYSLFTVVIAYDPLRGAAVERTPLNLVKGMLELVPLWGPLIYDKLVELGIVQAAFDFVNGQLAAANLSLTRVERLISQAWDAMDFMRLDPLAYNIGVLEDTFGPLLRDINTFAGGLVTALIDLVKDAAVDWVDGLIAENRAWLLIKKVLRFDPLKGEPVEATTVEVLEDFLLLIGRETELEEMKKNGTLEETADWLDTQTATFFDLLTSFGTLISAAVEAIRPENIAELFTNLRTLGTEMGTLLVRVWDFALTVAAKVLELVKKALLGWLSSFAHEVPGFHLVTVLLGRNPFTEEPVARSAENLIRGFITLLPGGAGIYRQLAETGVTGQAGATIETAVSELGISWEMVTGLFRGIWDGLGIEDLVDPIGAFTRIRDQFGEPISRLFRFVTIVIREVFYLILALMKFPTELIGRIIANAMEAIDNIRADPIGFLLNMVRAVKVGFGKFFENIVDHLLGGLMDWLFRGLREAGIEPPSELTVESVLDLTLQILDLSIDRLWEKLAQRFGQERVDQIRAGIDKLVGIWEFVRDVQENGLSAIWSYIESQISNLWDVILDKAKNWIMTKIIANVTTKLLSMLDPTGVMAVVNSFIAFFKAIQSAIEYLREMLEIVDSYVSTMAAIARGDVEPGAVKLEQGLASAIPVAIGFLANQVGLGNIGEKIAEIVGSIREVVDKALDWLLDQAERMLQAVLRALGVGGEDEDLDPTDHRAVASRAIDELRESAGTGNYADTRTRVQAAIPGVERRYSDVLESGIGLRVRMAAVESDAGDNDLDVKVIIAPNTTEVDGEIEIDVGGEVFIIVVVDDKRIEIDGVRVAKQASPERALADITQGLELEPEAAQALIDELNRRQLLDTDAYRALFISFAMQGPGDPVAYQRRNLVMGTASRAARRIPTGSDRNLLVDQGVTEDGEQRETLSDVANVFWEQRTGQFESRQIQRDATQGGSKGIEYVYRGDGQPTVRNLGIVRVDDSGTIVEIIQVTSEAGSRERFIEIMRRARWTVSLD